MLFYAGKTRSLGEVHRGNTVTDYLMQERERGITICSSAVTFSWKGKRLLTKLFIIMLSSMGIYLFKFYVAPLVS